MSIELDSSAYFYNCAHGASNSPCPWHFPEGSQVMPDNWMETYEPPTPPGLHDALQVAPEA